MAPLVERLRAYVNARSAAVCPAGEPPSDLCERTGLVLTGRGAAEVILRGDTAVELGHPSVASRAAVLTTVARELEHGRIHRIGPDLGVSPPRPFGQVVILRLREGIPVDPFDLENAAYLTNRLPGYMVRSVPGRLWVRVSHRALRRGLRLEVVGQALCAVYRARFEAVRAVEVVFVTSSDEDVLALSPLVAEAAVLSGRHKKLSLTADGEAECVDLDCERCDEKPVCDDLKDIAIKRRRRT